MACEKLVEEGGFFHCISTDGAAKEALQEDRDQLYKDFISITYEYSEEEIEDAKGYTLRGEHTDDILIEWRTVTSSEYKDTDEASVMALYEEDTVATALDAADTILAVARKSTETNADSSNDTEISEDDEDEIEDLEIYGDSNATNSDATVSEAYPEPSVEPTGFIETIKQLVRRVARFFGISAANIFPLVPSAAFMAVLGRGRLLYRGSAVVFGDGEKTWLLEK